MSRQSLLLLLISIYCAFGDENCKVGLLSGATSLTDEKFPSLAKILDTKTNGFICNAIIISKNQLLTAPSCLERKRDVKEISVLLREFNQNENVTLNVFEIFFHPKWSSTFKNEHESNVAIVITETIPFYYFILTTCLRQFLIKNEVHIQKIPDSSCDNINDVAKKTVYIEVPFLSSKSGAFYGQFQGQRFLFGFYSEEVIESQICDQKTFKSFEDFKYFLHCEEFSLTTVKGSKVSDSFCSKDLIFHEEFESLDKETWKHENTLRGGGNWEFQWYVNDQENSFVKDGILHIKPTLTNDKMGKNFVTKGIATISRRSCTDDDDFGCLRNSEYGTINPIRSASISTVNSFAFKYGTVEIRAKVAAGDWLASTITLLPKNTSAYGKWPRNGEIDILESRGNRNLFLGDKNIGVEAVSSGFSFGLEWDQRVKLHTEANNTSGFNNDFHVFKLVWTPEEIKTFVDGTEAHYLKIGNVGLGKQFGIVSEENNLENPWKNGKPNAPFDKEFYIAINLKAGGMSDFFPDDATNPHENPWKKSNDHAATNFWKAKDEWLSTWKENEVEFQIDYVKVTAL